ncbi:MAG: transposase [Clostridiaceae bacterium]|nr:transposase [Clostridiaceae bacterium]
MPRIARQKSNSGIYHVMLRGANRQEIFHDDEDNTRFLETLNRYKDKSEISVYGWCLMGNHVHLLLQEGNEELSLTMKRIGVSYVWFYNWKYKTTGHLFQDRYRSESIESDEALMAVIRYIHQNPVKAGIVSKPEEWKWSSCQGYYGYNYYPPLLIDSGLILGMFSEDKKLQIKRFIEYNDMENEDNFLDDENKHRLTDKEAREEIKKVIGEFDIAAIKSLPKLQRDLIIGRIKAVEGVSQRQVSRVTGIPISLVNRVK